MHIDNGWLVEAQDGHYGAKSSDRGGYTPKWLVIHGTAGGSSAADTDNWFTNGLVNGQPVQASAHVIIDQAGTAIQGISFDLAAWANCCTSAGHASYIASGDFHNRDTISIEHVKVHDDNSDVLTDIQAKLSFEVVLAICDAYGIPKRPGDADGGIVRHADLDPVNRARCPGPYPWDELWNFLNNGGNTPMSIPPGYTDDGVALTCVATGYKVVLGFRDELLRQGQNWQGGDALEDEHGANPVEEYYDQVPPDGTRQLFNYCELGYTATRGVYVVGIGNELRGARADRDLAKGALATAQTQIATLQQQVADNVVVKDARSVFAALDKLKADVGA